MTGATSFNGHLSALAKVFQDPTTASVFIGTVALTFGISYLFFGRSRPRVKPPEPRDPPRNFTVAQLKEFNGEDDKPILIAVCGEVFDVSSAKFFYGKGGWYGLFAGRDATRAFAKNSLEEADLDNPRIDDLNYAERDSLDGWVMKFKVYKQYPIAGNLVTPPTGLKFTKEELLKYNGKQEVPEGYAIPPIYIAIKGKVYDMSFGGESFYGPGGPYHFLAGREASRALAKMSLDPKEVEDSSLEGLDEKQLKVLDDWEAKLSVKYPHVGNLV